MPFFLFFWAPCFLFPIFRQPDLCRRLFFSRFFYYCFPPSWETFIVFLFCLVLLRAFFWFFGFRPSLHFFLLVKKRALFLLATSFLLFFPFFSQSLHFLHCQLAHLKFGCLITFWARCYFFFYLVSEPGRSGTGVCFFFASCLEPKTRCAGWLWKNVFPILLSTLSSLL